MWWLTFTLVWAGYRLVDTPEWLSELIAKPVIWLGITALFWWRGLIPQRVVTETKTHFLHLRPIWKTVLFPGLFIPAYFLLINWSQLRLPHWSWGLLISAVSINLATAIVEEAIYRGVLYVWILQLTTEVKAFSLVQVLFLAAHLPTLLLHSGSVTAALVHTLFIVLLGAIYTIIFRWTKSLLTATIAHGMWNSLAYILLLA